MNEASIAKIKEPVHAFRAIAAIGRRIKKLSKGPPPPWKPEKSEIERLKKLIASVTHLIDPAKMGTTEILKAIDRGDLKETDETRELIKMVPCKALINAGFPAKPFLFIPEKPRPQTRKPTDDDSKEVWPGDPNYAKAGHYQIIKGEVYLVPDDLRQDPVNPIFEAPISEETAPVASTDKKPKTGGS